MLFRSPGGRYTDPAFLALEEAHVWKKTWLYGCHIDEIPEPGHFLLYKRLGAPVIIVHGKDGVVRHVFEGVNPSGVRVASFKQPSTLELSHNYLWRYFQQLPKRGEIVIFNRSHYESVLVERVHEIVPKRVWKRRYGHIAEMEQALADEGTTILKFFLHISKEEQKQRLQARLDDREKLWKFSLGDLAEREHWASYMEAYEEAIEQTSSEDAPWYVIPADKKWYRDLVISQIIVDTLKRLDMKYPKPASGLDSVVIPD